ncbi:hypothetical protein L1987_45952 [Smallanthus sonchifolius]|uniref:Uncharacterized protein n=1 Tax=Smallanthus sonchifolius TaxID=185202 RepID=A0ACB9FYY7_9ASTR|nr:hypothetical protein L1987_45952 [Smallanthus sonchifolius]
MIPPSVTISIENGGDSATPIQLAFLACLGHIDLTCSWAREREKEAWFDQTLIFLGKLPSEEKKTNYVVLHPQEFQSSSNQSVIDYCLCHLLLTLQRPFLTCNKAYFFRKIFDLCCHSQLPMQSDEKKVVRRTISNGEKLSSNRRGGTARSFGDKCFLRRSDPVERKSSSFFSSLRKAIVNIQAEVVSE